MVGLGCVCGPAGAQHPIEALHRLKSVFVSYIPPDRNLCPMTMLFRASRIRPFRLVSVAALLLATPRSAGGATARLPPATKRDLRQTSSQPGPDRSSAYYHYGLAHLYEEMAVNAGRPDYATQAVEEYKLALDADPNSALLQDGLADLYFKIGRIGRGERGARTR